MIDIKTPLPDETATVALGARLAPILRAGDVVCLIGPLGAGKTTLARGLIACAAGERQAPSPTFALVETYATASITIWHFDLYRLESADDVWELGLEEAFEDGVSLIEWPEKIERWLPPAPLMIGLGQTPAGRVATLRGGGDWPDRLAAAGIS